MNEAETRAELIDPALKAAPRRVVKCATGAAARARAVGTAARRSDLEKT